MPAVSIVHRPSRAMSDFRPMPSVWCPHTVKGELHLRADGLVKPAAI